MSKDNVKRAAKMYPSLKKEWEDYGHGIKWDNLTDAKISPTHGYVALCWDEKGDMVDYADLASPDGGKTWEMQNDGHDLITKAVWKKAKCVPDCDWLDIDR